MAIVATQVGQKWVAVEVGSFDGDGDFLEDLDGDGLAEIVTVDNRFLYEFDCYACSAAPLQVLTVRRGKVVDASAEMQFLPAHREWLRQMEANIDGADRWTSRGFLAGWVGASARVGKGGEAWARAQREVGPRRRRRRGGLPDRRRRSRIARGASGPCSSFPTG